MNKVLYSLIIIIVIGAAVYIIWPKAEEKGIKNETYSLDDKKDTNLTAAVLPETSNDVSSTPTPTPAIAINNIKNQMHTITIETNKGNIVFETYDADAPKAVTNFINLANKSYYNGIIFHRVIKDFMIQGGDPTGTGRGGPGYSFEDELNPATQSYKNGYKRGVVAMANAGPNTNGSQFFIMHKDTGLPNSYSIFGHVISGMEVVDAIASSKVDAGDRPLENIVMKKVTVAEKK